METLTISNDESPYFCYAPLPHPVAVEACCLTRSAEYVYGNVMVNTADGILIRALCAIQIRKRFSIYKFLFIEKSALLFHYSLPKCIALFGQFGASLQQIHCDC
ncbi:hypothetical protein Tsp_12817 [Trichinella spiralis]|uniref:hypothetical protein n=1 Tax=Trichinella spiralis TaxID=6334 RepID=UPI0001EFD21F|nr:hypothetical protein Tsp_12817 [Trichinella spiralis]